MIVGIGTDLVEVDDLRRRMERNPALRDGVFAPEEVAYCDQRPDPWPHLAARFAAKEATMKALGTGWAAGVAFTDIVVVVEPTPGSEASPPPRIRLQGEAARRLGGSGSRIHVSLTHTGNLAQAFVVIEGTVLTNQHFRSTGKRRIGGRSGRLAHECLEKVS
jgi:holo-[acyl-carrier protein] synthase